MTSISSPAPYSSGVKVEVFVCRSFWLFVNVVSSKWCLRRWVHGDMWSRWFDTADDTLLRIQSRKQRPEVLTTLYYHSCAESYMPRHLLTDSLSSQQLIFTVCFATQKVKTCRLVC